MFEPIENTTFKINQHAGPEFSFKEKIKMGGTGTMKLIHIHGINAIQPFDISSQALYYLSFELRPNAIICRTYNEPKQTFFLMKGKLESIIFETFKIKVRSRLGFVIRQEARVNIKTVDRTSTFYVPASNYKTLKKFFKKAWLNEKTSFIVSEKEPEVDKHAQNAAIIAKILNAINP